MSPFAANSLRCRQTSADFCTVSTIFLLMQEIRWIWLRDYRCLTKAKSRMDCTVETTHHQPLRIGSIPGYVSVLFPLDIHQYQPLLINPFWISHCLSFEPSPLAAHPAASPATLMVFSHINQLIKSKFQWWINVPELMRWSASCCYQSTCCQMIVSCRDVWHYEVHLETQLSYNGSNRSKSIFGTGRLFVIHALLEKSSLSLLVSHMHVVLPIKREDVFALHPSGCFVQFPLAFL